MTASISLNPSSSVVIGQKVNARLVISNSDTINAVTLLTVTPLAYPTSGSPTTPGSTACALGPVPLTANQPNMINAASSLSIPFTVTFFDPSNGTYSVTAYINTSDGSSFAPTPATISIAQLPIETSGNG